MNRILLGWAAFLLVVMANASTTMEMLEKEANAGDASSQYALGIAFDAGIGVVKDPAQALTWYRQAAEQGNSGAQFMLGLNYQSGKQVPMDRVEALRWFQLAAEQGHARARSFLASAQMIGTKVNGWATATVDPAVLVGPLTRNGGFEIPGKGGADVFLDWTEGTNGSTTWTRDTTTVWQGSASARLDIDGKNSPARLYFSSILVAGARYKLTFMIRHNKPSAITSLQYNDGGSPDTVLNVQPIAPKTWTAVEIEFVARGTGFGICRPSIAGLAGYSCWIDNVSITAAGRP